MKTLYLIDGYAQFFRAYHAIRTPMTSPVTGEPTNMNYGFMGMLLKLLKNDGMHMLDEGRADYIAVTLDIGGDQGTFRSQLYPDYKANRDAPPEDLFPQVERAIEMLEAIGVPVIGCEGFEADDVLATIATDFSNKHPDIRVRIISKDKDLKQLLGEGTPPTEMYDVHKDQLITEADLMEDLGIRPDQMIDLLTLMGDTADNIPGVVGIGIKTAAKLLIEFDTLEGVFEAAKQGTIKGKRQENILASETSLPLSKELVTLRHDVPIELDLSKCRSDDLDLDKLIEYCKEFGFNRYQDDIKRLIVGESPAEQPKPTTKKKPEQADPFSLFNQPTEESSAPAVEVDGDYRIVRTTSALNQLVKELLAAPIIAVDTETTNINPMWAELVGVSVSIESGKGYYIPTRSPDPSSHLNTEQVIEALRPALEDESIAKVGQNIKYDLLIFKNAGVELRGFVPIDKGSNPRSSAGDTMIASYVLDSSRSSHSMDNLALAFLERTNLSIKDLIGSGKNQKRFDEVALDLAGPYAAEDADVTLQLNEKLAPMIHAEPSLEKLYREVEMPLVEVLATLEYNGVQVSKSELNNQETRLQKRIDELVKTIDDEAKSSIARTFDLNSPKQLSAALFNKPDDEVEGLGIKPIKKTKTGYSTNAEVLEKLALDPEIETKIPSLILEYRQLSKLVSTYLKALAEAIHPETKRIHASFNQTVAATGRLSSSDPNLQNIPIRTDIGREIRKAFVAPDGHQLISADYSQIELRILAHLSEDPALIEAFLAGEDIHQAVAAQINDIPLDQVTKEQRSGAKMVNFGIVYGVTPWGLARRLKVSNSEASEIIDNYKAKFANITSFLEECVTFARSHGYVETMLGRRRPINDIDDRNPQRKGLAERMAINSVVQGSAADLIKLTMIDLHRHINTAESDSPLFGSKMILQIHDELVFETPTNLAPAAKNLIVERMEAAMDLKVPLTVDANVSSDWFGGK
jgi:DNA polymerase-1